MIGKSMKMELDGKEIKLEFPDLTQNYTINYYKKIEQSMNENTSVFEINEIMFRNVNSVSKVIENVVKTEINIK